MAVPVIAQGSQAIVRPDNGVASPDAVNPSLHPVHTPANAQGWALAILATIAVIFALEWAESFFIPVLLGILLSYTLNPLVEGLERIRIHRVVGASLVIVAVICALAFGTYSLRGQMLTVIEQLPEVASQLSINLAKLGQGQLGAMQKVQTAASQLEQAASQATGIPSTHQKPATRVVIDDSFAFKTGNFLWAGSMGAVGYMVQATMVLFLVYFLLLSGDIYKRKLVRLTGPSLSNKKITVQILSDINHSIQRYMFMLLITNGLVGLLAWMTFYWIGLDNAGAWAVAAGLLHIIPYLGPGLMAIAVGMVAFMQFDSLPMVLLVSGSWLIIATFVGTFVMTWMTGRIARMNSAAVFISLLFWG